MASLLSLFVCWITHHYARLQFGYDELFDYYLFVDKTMKINFSFIIFFKEEEEEKEKTIEQSLWNFGQQVSKPTVQEKVTGNEIKSEL